MARWATKKETEGGQNWLKIMSNGRFWYKQASLVLPRCKNIKKVNFINSC
jgi:hypothetical protein